MTKANLEHANITVSDVERTAAMLTELFGWKVRWKGPAMSGGLTAHVGDENQYLAIFSKGGLDQKGITYDTPGGLNHIGVVVDDLDAMEEKVREMGFTPHNHADYEPGRRFYFSDHDDIEFELVSYD